MPGYDYRRQGAYFVTIVTNGRRLLFGEVVEGEMTVNAAGRVIKTVWETLPARFPTIEIGASVIMPNHFHGIIVLSGNVGATLVVAHDEPGVNGGPDHAGRDHGIDRAGINPAPTGDGFEAGPRLGAIIGAFKSLSTRAYMRGVREGGWTPFDKHLWQRGYYERIIRDQREWEKIHLYIESNPSGWETDEENPEGGERSAYSSRLTRMQ